MGPANSFARNEVRSPKTEAKLRFAMGPANPFARNEVRSPKTAVKLRFAKRPATLSHEMMFDRQKLWLNVRLHAFSSVCKSFSVWKCLCVKASVCKSFSM